MRPSVRYAEELRVFASSESIRNQGGKSEGRGWAGAAFKPGTSTTESALAELSSFSQCNNIILQLPIEKYIHLFIFFLF